MIGKANSFRCVQQHLKKLLALDKRRPPKVKPVAINQVEREENHGHTGNQVFRRSAYMHAFLQKPKIAAPVSIDRRDFSIQNRLAHGD